MLKFVATSLFSNMLLKPNGQRSVTKLCFSGINLWKLSLCCERLATSRLAPSNWTDVNPKWQLFTIRRLIHKSNWFQISLASLFNSFPRKSYRNHNYVLLTSEFFLGLNKNTIWSTPHFSFQVHQTHGIYGWKRVCSWLSSRSTPLRIKWQRNFCTPLTAVKTRLQTWRKQHWQVQIKRWYCRKSRANTALIWIQTPQS